MTAQIHTIGEARRHREATKAERQRAASIARHEAAERARRERLDRILGPDPDDFWPRPAA